MSRARDCKTQSKSVQMRHMKLFRSIIVYSFFARGSSLVASVEFASFASLTHVHLESIFPPIWLWKNRPKKSLFLGYRSCTNEFREVKLGALRKRLFRRSNEWNCHVKVANRTFVPTLCPRPRHCCHSMSVATKSSTKNVGNTHLQTGERTENDWSLFSSSQCSAHDSETAVELNFTLNLRKTNRKQFKTSIEIEVNNRINIIAR